jgi:hypothetical protein
MNLLRLVMAAAVALVVSSGAALAQCGTQAPANKFCGNDTGVSALATWKSVPTGALSAIAGGTVLGNSGTSAAVPSALTAPVLGIPGTSTGQIGLAGLTSGTATLKAQSAAGSATSLLPTAAGTLVGSSSAPLSIDPVTGTMTCPTCVTSSGGGAITGTAPISVSAGGVVSINAPYVTLTASNGGIVYSGATNLAILAGTATARQMLQSGASTTPAWSTATWPATTAAGTVLTSASANTVTASATPVLGVPSSVQGALGFAGVTSGTVTVTAQATAGTATVTLPNASGTVAVSASAPLALSATTGALTCTTCVTTLTSGTTPTSGYTNTQILGSNGSVLLAYSVSGSGNVALTTSPVFTTPSLGVATGTSLALGGATIGSNALAVTGTSAFGGATSVGTSSVTAFTVGAGANPAFLVDTSTASQAAGINIKGAATGGTVTIAAIDSGSNTNISLNAKGTGTIAIGNVSTGAVTITPATTITGILTLGGSSISSPSPVSFLNVATAQSINTGGFCADSTYANCSTLPANGAQILGLANLKGGLTITGTVTSTSLVLSGGATVSAPAALTTSFTADCGRGPIQPITGPTSAWSITAPAADGSCLFILTNPGASAVVPTFSGFSVGSNVGAAITTVASAKFTINIWRANGISGYSVFAHQ